MFIYPYNENEIYFPAEDSEILMNESFNIFKNIFLKHKKINVCEIGIGSGYISYFVLKMSNLKLKNSINTNYILKPKYNKMYNNKYHLKRALFFKKWLNKYYILNKFYNIKIIGLDINQQSIYWSRRNNITSINSNLFSIFELNKKLRQNLIQKLKFDLIIFNPPYLPTSKYDKLDSKLNYAFDGGKDGASTVCLFLDKAKHYLNKNGTIIFIISSITNINIIYHMLKKEYSNVKVVNKLKCSFETLLVFLCQKKNT